MTDDQRPSAKPLKPPFHPLLVLAVAIVLPGVGQLMNNQATRGLLFAFTAVALGYVTSKYAAPDASIVGRYAALLVAPYRLAIDYSASVFTSKLDLHEPYFYIGCIVLAAAVIFAIIAWRRRWPVVFFCLIAPAMLR